MTPYLLILEDTPSIKTQDFLSRCQISPVDILFITEKSEDNQTYLYVTSSDFLKNLKEIAEDYEAILLLDRTLLQKFSLSDSIYDGYFCLMERKLILHQVIPEDILRFFYIEGFHIYQNDALLPFHGLTLLEFEKLTQSFCLENRAELEHLLTEEVPITCLFEYPHTQATQFIQPFETSKTKAVLRLENQTPQKELFATEFLFVRPHYEVWLTAKPFATLGGLNFDLSKLLKDAKIRKELIIGIVIAEESALNEMIYTFLEPFETYIEKELNLTLSTTHDELQSLAKKHKRCMIADRISKISRMVLVDKELL